MYDILKECNLFDGLKESEIEELFVKINWQQKKYRNNNIIALSGDRVTGLKVVLEGSVKGEMIDFTGKKIKIEDIESPRSLAPAFLFGDQDKYPVNIVANNDVKILSIPKEEFLKMLSASEKVLNNYLSIISNRAQFLSGKLKFLSFQTIKGKIAHYLLALSIRSGEDAIILDKTQSELSELFGITRPSLARAIKEMDKDGLISARGKEVVILDRKRLSSLLK
ncbi:MAG TPA: Crp/Fnr family transcriptional regulator [Bacteroidales bacterium]|nr:Crp/Fnr family transcriptional regulator [Bacteroidales bacterium]